MGFLAAQAAFAGTITGVVSARAPELPPAAAGAGAGYGSRTLSMAEKVNYEELTDFVVYINQEVPGANRPPPAPATVTQYQATFEPHVLPIMVGTTVNWPNRDPIFHNVYSTSDARSFNLKYYKQETVPQELFDQKGRVDVFCAIHTRMHCIVLVLPSPFFAKADARGRYSISGIPPGTYRLRAWHERLPAQEQTIVVPAEGEVKMDFALSVAAAPVGPAPSPPPSPK